MNTTMEDVEVMVYLFLFLLVYGVLCVAISLITGFQNGSFDFCKGVTNVTPLYSLSVQRVPTLM